MAKIVCLDGYALNPGDISWEPFRALGDLLVHERTAPADIVSRAAGCPFLLTNKTPISAQTLEALPALRYVGVLATGYNIVDVEAATTRGIVVTNVPTYGTDSVAQHVAALLLALVRPITVHAEAVARGAWSESPDWCFALTPITSLTGRVLGIVGVGRIGLAVARIGAAMGMGLLGHDPYWPTEEHLGGLVIARVELDELFERADVITLHCPLSEDNHHLVDGRRLALMKRDALLINTSRGPLIDAGALAQALRGGKLAGAALDVLEQEPPEPSNPLLGLPNCIVTPHIAWYARSARQRLMDSAAENLAAYLRGEVRNAVG